jgi:hypothetical protein
VFRPNVVLVQWGFKTSRGGWARCFMRVTIEPFSPHHLPSIRSFNARLRAAGTDPGFLLPEEFPADAPPEQESRPVDKRQFIVVDDGVVRGGYMLQKQEFVLDGQYIMVGNIQMPITEGVIDKKFSALGGLLVREILRACPLLFALGMGGRHNSFPRLLQAMGWTLLDIPFLFYVNHPNRFLQNIGPLRRSGARRAIASLAAGTGVGGAGIRLLQARITRPTPVPSVEPVPDFDVWADELWSQCWREFFFCGVRTSGALGHFYPARQTRYLRYRMTIEGAVVGWALLVDTQMRDHPYFGNLRVGTIVDGIALPAHTAATVRAAAQLLEKRGVDLTICNHSHASWMSALRRVGFQGYASNYVFAASKELARLLQPLPENLPRIFINRGDGEGPTRI